MDLAALTFDIDWAPDWAIRECRDFCERQEISATFYATHESEETAAIGEIAVFELGIHPNFLDGSSQGKTEREVLDFCLRIVPGARSMRCHGLVQSSRLFSMVADDYPTIDSDSSIFLPHHSGLRPTNFPMGRSQRNLVRLPYYWGDYFFDKSPEWKWTDQAPESDGLKIFNVHPVLFALNLSDINKYEMLKAAIGETPMSMATREDFSPFVNKGLGEQAFLEGAIKLIGRDKFLTMSQITDAFANGDPAPK